MICIYNNNNNNNILLIYTAFSLFLFDLTVSDRPMRSNTV